MSSSDSMILILFIWTVITEWRLSSLYAEYRADKREKKIDTK